MLSPGSGNTVIKSKLIGRRMFLITAAKAIVMVGLVGRLISLQINQTKPQNTNHYLIKIDLENGSWHLKEEQLKIFLIQK